MWVVIDKRAPEKAKERLREEFQVFEFESSDISYEEVSGHPDIFMFQGENNLIIAPNSPEKFISFLEENNIKFEFGVSEIGDKLNSSTAYNCIESDEYFFHKENFSDKKILEKVIDKKHIKLPQAYTRCSLSKLSKNNFITADRGISKVLKSNNFKVLEIDDQEILLPGFKNGFFGGTNSYLNNKLYLVGSLKHHRDQEKINSFLKELNIELIELYDGPLMDVGGLFFL